MSQFIIQPATLNQLLTSDSNFFCWCAKSRLKCPLIGILSHIKSIVILSTYPNKLNSFKP